MLHHNISRLTLLLGFGVLQSIQAEVIAHWSFDTPAVDGKYLDSSGNNLHLNAASDAGFTSSAQRFGTGALDLIAEQRVNLVLPGTPAGGALGLENNSFSFSFWVKRHSLEVAWLLGQGKNMVIEAQKNRLLHIGFREIDYRSGTAPCTPSLAFQSDDVSILVKGSYPIDTENWHHYVMSFDAETREQRIVINGDVVNDTRRISNDLFLGDPESNDFYVGNRFGNNKYFDGLLDELWVFDTALSDDEIVELYTNNMGVGENHHYVDIPEPMSFALIIGLASLGLRMMPRRRRSY